MIMLGTRELKSLAQLFERRVSEFVFEQVHQSTEQDHVYIKPIRLHQSYLDHCIHELSTITNFNVAEFGLFVGQPLANCSVDWNFKNKQQLKIIICFVYRKSFIP